jgi:hypothetical protein
MVACSKTFVTERETLAALGTNPMDRHRLAPSPQTSPAHR